MYRRLLVTVNPFHARPVRELTIANLQGVPGQRPQLRAFVAPLSSTMGVWFSVVLFHGGLCFRSPMAEKPPNNALSPRAHGGATDLESAPNGVLFPVIGCSFGKISYRWLALPDLFIGATIVILSWNPRW